jgi:hypothetical protein
MLSSFERDPKELAEEIVRKKKPEGATKANGHDTEGVSLSDFRAYMPQHSYIFVPTREPWPAASVNARIPPVPLLDATGRHVLDDKGEQKTISASRWLDQNQSVAQMTWAPGEPLLIENRLIDDGGWIERNNITCLNLYRPPIIKLGNAAQAGPWLEHVHKVFASDAEHVIRWLAHRVQRPQQKINHALVLGGPQGVGKDTILEPVKHAIGAWNFRETSPTQIMGRFNGFLKAVILRVSEAHDTGAETDRFKLYEHMKVYTVSPPDVLLCDEKNLRAHSIPNVCGVIITTNHKTDGLFLPPDDRRHYVAWSDLTKDDFTEAYWNTLWGWYDRGGGNHVAAYLADLDLSGFNAKAPPPKTQAFWEIVHASRAPEDAELADVIDLLGNPDIVTASQVASRAPQSFADWLLDRKNSRRISHRFEECGYVAVRNDAAKSGLWVLHSKRQVIYAKASLAPRDRIAACQRASGAR